MKNRMVRHRTAVALPFLSRAILLIAVIGSAGCAHVIYTETTKHESRGAHSASSVEIFLQEQPRKPYQAVGTIESVGYGVGEGINAIRDAAAEHGLDGVFNVYCAPPGTVGWGNCSGTAFLWK